jgi:hypothetical protein
VVELAAAVVAHDDAVEPGLGGADRLLGTNHALEQDRAVPQLPDPVEVLPAHAAVEHVRELLARAVVGRADVREADRVRREEAPRPRRMQRAVEERARAQVRFGEVQPGVLLALAFGPHRSVDAEQHASKPAARARSSAAFAARRSPQTYSWNQSGLAPCAATSSTAAVASVDSPYGMPAARAARATANSPS